MEGETKSKKATGTGLHPKASTKSNIENLKSESKLNAADSVPEADGEEGDSDSGSESDEFSPTSGKNLKFKEIQKGNRKGKGKGSKSKFKGITGPGTKGTGSGETESGKGSGGKKRSTSRRGGLKFGNSESDSPEPITEGY